MGLKYLRSNGLHIIYEIIIADRGEFEGYSVENLINNLNIKIENTTAYRGI